MGSAVPSCKVLRLVERMWECGNVRCGEVHQFSIDSFALLSLVCSCLPYLMSFLFINRFCYQFNLEEGFNCRSSMLRMQRFIAERSVTSLLANLLQIVTMRLQNLLAGVFLTVIGCTIELSDSIQVQVELNSPVSNDISCITHDIQERLFQIELKPERRCSNPTFLLRLSGAALFKLDLVSQQDGFYAYQYPALIDAGQYFFDAIVLFCDTYNPNNQTEICLVDASYRKNVINGPYSFTVQPSDIAVSSVPVPRWRNTAAPTFLPSRYQKLIAEPLDGLTCKETYKDMYCAPEELQLRPFQSYQWTDSPPWAELVALIETQRAPEATPMLASMEHARGPKEWPVKQKRRESPTKINICFVGDSHARELTWNSQGYPAAQSAIHFTYIVNITPLAFGAGLFHQHRCSIAVLSYGQWFLSGQTPSLITRDTYTKEIQRVFDAIEQYRGPTKIFLRSENYNGLGVQTRACPSRDQRSPPAFDAINAAMQATCATYQVPYINLNAVIGPMWDAAPDYNHPASFVLRAEVDVILHAVFSHIINRNETIRTHTEVQLQAVKAYSKQEMHEEVLSQLRLMGRKAALLQPSS